MTQPNNKTPTRLKYHFAIGYDCLDYADQCITLFKGDGVALLLGHLFRIHYVCFKDLPRVLYYGPDKHLHYISQRGALYSLQKVANGIMTIELEGPNKGKAKHFEKKPKDKFMSLHRSKTNASEMTYVERVISVMG